MTKQDATDSTRTAAHFGVGQWGLYGGRVPCGNDVYAMSNTDDVPGITKAA